MSHEAWLEQARSDLEAASVLSQANFHSQAVWLAAQAVEKGHKAILSALGLQYQEKHFKTFGHEPGQVLALLPEVLQDPVDPQLVAALTALTARGKASRYPAPPQLLASARGSTGLVSPAKSMTESSQDLTDARELLEWCRTRIARASKALAAMGK